MNITRNINVSNSNLLILGMIIFIFSTNMYNYFEGDRVPNLSVLICGFIAFFALKNVFNELFNNMFTGLLTFWNKYLSIKYDYFINLTNQIKGFIYLIFVYLISLKLITYNFIFNSITNGRLLWLYMYINNVVSYKIYTNITTIIYIEKLVYKFYNIFMITNNYKNIESCWKWLWLKNFNNVNNKLY